MVWVIGDVQGAGFERLSIDCSGTSGFRMAVYSLFRYVHIVYSGFVGFYILRHSERDL